MTTAMTTNMRMTTNTATTTFTMTRRMGKGCAGERMMGGIQLRLSRRRPRAVLRWHGA
jgi:hypothetical protein